MSVASGVATSGARSVEERKGHGDETGGNVRSLHRSLRRVSLTLFPSVSERVKHSVTSDEA